MLWGSSVEKGRIHLCNKRPISPSFAGLLQLQLEEWRNAETCEVLIQNNQHLGCHSVFAVVQGVESLIEGHGRQQDMLQAIERFHLFAKAFKALRQSQMFILSILWVCNVCCVPQNYTSESCVSPRLWSYQGHSALSRQIAQNFKPLHPSGSCVRTCAHVLVSEEGSSLKNFWRALFPMVFHMVFTSGPGSYEVQACLKERLAFLP